MRPLLYICGPYTGHDSEETNDNISVAREYAIAAWRKGWAVFCPHLNTAHFEQYLPEIAHSERVDADLDIISRLEPDAMLLLPGWSSGSAGSAREFTLAQELDIETLGPYPTPNDVPVAPKLCPAYRRVHYETDSRDTCGSADRRCPAGVTCPIRKRCKGGLGKWTAANL